MTGRHLRELETVLRDYIGGERRFWRIEVGMELLGVVKGKQKQEKRDALIKGLLFLNAALLGGVLAFGMIARSMSG